MGIATGGVVPDGADAVIPFEVVVEHDNTVEIGEAVAPGTNVRPRGGDLRAGDEVVAAGTRLGPTQLGALAAAGWPRSAAERCPAPPCWQRERSCAGRTSPLRLARSTRPTG
jgi:molybdopterin molybdotransferase